MTQPKKIHIKGGPQGSHISHLEIDGVSHLNNTNSFVIRGGVDGMVKLDLSYLILDVDLEIDGVVKHRAMLQQTVWRTNPVDGEIEKSPHREYMTVDSDDGLPDALRTMAARLEEEGRLKP